MPCIRIMPKLLEAPESGEGADSVLTFLVNNRGRAFASAGAFGNKFAAKPRNAGQAV
jgi:hypothetical protein